MVYDYAGGKNFARIDMTKKGLQITFSSPATMFGQEGKYIN